MLIMFITEVCIQIVQEERGHMYNRLFILFCLIAAVAQAEQFSVSSFNCGGLSDYYDYKRAACMQKLMQERYNSEPLLMADARKIETLALTVLFACDEEIRQKSRDELDQLEPIYQKLIQIDTFSQKWREKSEKLISPYTVRPVQLDSRIQQLFCDLAKGRDCAIDGLYRDMAKHIFSNELSQDFICLQEANYLTKELFPEPYQLLLAENDRSVNGIAWNQMRFEFVELAYSIDGKAFVACFRERYRQKRVAIASCHLSGCNPFFTVEDPVSHISDSAKGDGELKRIIDFLDGYDADIKVIAMDANVTACHPRLSLLREAGYQIDYKNYLEPTCTNPYLLIDTKIDWIAVKARQDVRINNVPVNNVCLNSIQTNMSDHKPIAAVVHFS